MSVSHIRSAFFIPVIAAGLRCAYAQQAVSPIEQARLFKESPASTSREVDANGSVLSDDDASSDGSFGEQVILQSRPRIPTFALTGDASVYYTDNAALTPHNRIKDALFVSDAGASWTRKMASHFEAQIAVRSSIVRYDKTSELDFQSLGLGAGLFWNPEHLAGVELFVHYDLIELIDRHCEEILRDHEFTIGTQKVFPLGRAHVFAAGASLSAGIAAPGSAQRDQAALFLDYRLQATRSLTFEFLYRFAGYFYNDPGRTDRTQLWSVSARYRLLEWADINAFFSFANNRSDNPAFSYDAATSGGGLCATIRF